MCRCSLVHLLQGNFVPASLSELVGYREEGAHSILRQSVVFPCGLVVGKFSALNPVLTTRESCSFRRRSPEHASFPAAPLTAVVVFLLPLPRSTLFEDPLWFRVYERAVSLWGSSVGGTEGDLQQVGPPFCSHSSVFYRLEKPLMN